MNKVVIFTMLFFATSCCGASKSAKQTDVEQTAESKEQLIGGYTAQRTPTDEEITLFKSATSELDGVSYTPESVATQVVAGTNYRFVCTAITATREPITYKAEVVVFKPLPNQGEPKITNITKL